MRNYYNSFGLRISSDSKTQVGNKAIPRPMTNLSSTKSLWAILLLFVALMTSNQKMLAQASSANYSFSSNTSGSLSDMTGSTQLVGPGLDATASPVTNIGFDLFFMGNRFTQFSVQEDGILQLGGTAVGTNAYTLTGGTATSPRLSAFNADLRTGLGNGKIHYRITGTAPNRILTVEFLNMQLFYTSNANAVAGTSTWQMRLFENGNIEYVYGSMSAVNITSTDRLPSIGFYTGSAAGSYAAVSYAAHTVSTTTYAANPAIAAVGAITNLNSSEDGSRRVYQFIPPGNSGNAIATSLAAPTNLTFSAVSSSSMTLNWNASSPMTGVQKYAVFRSTDGGTSFTLQTLVNGGTNTLAVTGLTSNTNYLWKVFAISEGAKSSDLQSAQLTNPPGTFTSVATGNWDVATTWDAGSVPTSVDNAVISASHTVSVNATGLMINNLTVNGTLDYGTTPTAFNVNGNLTVSNTGTVNAFNGTTGKSLTVTGNITNNGVIDFSKGTATTNILTLNGTNVQTISGSGTFTDGIIRNLTFNNTSTVTPNINWEFNNLSIGGTLTFTAGKVALGSNKITLGSGTATGTGAAAVGSLSYTAGGFTSGKFVRYWSAASTGTSITSGSDPGATNGTSRYPFISALGQQRSAFVERSTAPAAGQLSCVYVDAATVSNASIVDGTYTVQKRFDGNWTFSTEGSAYATASQEVLLLGNGAYGNNVIGSGNSRIVLASSSAGGTHQMGTTTPGAQRVLSTGELTAGSLYMGLADSELSQVVNSIASGNWNDASTWDKGAAPGCNDIVNIVAGHVVTVNSTGNLSKNVNIFATGNLTVASGDLTIGCTLKNNALVNNGTLTISGGTLTLNGRFDMNNGASLNQSGGSFVVDGNDAGNVANSVASGTPIFRIGNSTTSYSTGTISLTGGEIVITDPHTATTNTSGYALYVYFPTGFNVESGSGHTFKFGDGVSVDGGGNTSGFYVDAYVSSGRLNFGNVIVNTPIGTNRNVTFPFATGIHGNLGVTAGTLTPVGGIILKGNLNVTGTYIASSAIVLAQPSGTTFVANNSTQSIGYASPGAIKNLATAETANLTSLTVNNSGGVTLNSPLSVSGTITLTAGLVNTTSVNLLTSGTATLAGTITGGSATSYINGPLAKTFATGSANTSYSLFPVGKTSYAPIWLAPATTTAAVIKAESFTLNSGTADPSIINLSANTRWEAPVLSGTVTNLNVRLGATDVASTSIPVQAPTAGGVYTNAFGSLATQVAGTPNTTQSNTALASASYTGFLSFADSNACSGTPNPGNTVASATQICLGTTVSLSLQNATSGTGVTYAWESSTNGSAYAPISGATAATYSAIPTATTFYRAKVTCSGITTDSTPVEITFFNAITDTTPASRCGLGTVSLEAVANAGATIKWYDAASGGSVVGNGSQFLTPSISASTTYYVASETVASGSIGLGNGASTSSSAGDTFFPGAWGGAKTQYIIRASELIAAGLGAGNITSIGFEPTNSGQTYQGFQVNIGHTANTTAPASTFVSSGLTQVYAGTLADNGFTPVANAVNTLAFGTGTGSATSFNWDGTSNIVVSISWSRVPSASTSTSTSMKVDNVGFVSSAYRQRDSTTPASMASETSVSSTTSFRPRFLINGQVICSSPRVAVLATVNTPPALTLSGVPAAICSGDNSASVTLTAGSTDYDVFDWSPSTGVTGNSTTGWVFNPTATTTFTLTASQSTGALCNATVSIVITVNSLPSALTIAPSPATVCENTVLTLTATGGTIGVEGKIGSGTATSTTVTPFKGNWGGSKLQTIYTVSELTALGVLPGQKISKIGYVATVGTPAPLNNFTINAGFVSANTLGTGFINGANTVVYAPATYTPSTGNGNIDFVLPVTLVWDGVSNLLIETCFNNNNSGVTGTAISVQSSTVASGLCLYRSQDNTADVCSNATAPTSSTTRPNLRLSTLEAADLTWYPVANLFTDEGATTAYVAGTIANTVYFKSGTPAGAVSYTATATSEQSCFVTASVDVTVTALVTPNFAPIGTICSTSTAPTLATTSPNGVTGTWSPAVVSTTANGSYVFTPTAGSCASTQTLDVVVTQSVTPNFAPIGTICSSSTAPTLATTSPNGVTGTWSPAVVSTTANGSYVFTPTTGLCASTQTLDVVVTTSPAQPSGASTQYGATLADLVITPSAVTWYDNESNALNGTGSIPASTTTVDGATYYAVAVSGSCSSTPFAVTIDFGLSSPSFGLKALKVYPNPVRDILTISYSENISGYKLYNALGQQLMTRNSNATETKVDMSSLPAGTYLLEVSAGGKSKMVKLLKN